MDEEDDPNLDKDIHCYFYFMDPPAAESAPQGMDAALKELQDTLKWANESESELSKIDNEIQYLLSQLVDATKGLPKKDPLIVNAVDLRAQSDRLSEETESLKRMCDALKTDLKTATDEVEKLKTDEVERLKDQRKRLLICFRDYVKAKKSDKKRRKYDGKSTLLNENTRKTLEKWIDSPDDFKDLFDCI
jgi:peptidoglycan hydrolase CwlO-like protein